MSASLTAALPVSVRVASRRLVGHAESLLASDEQVIAAAQAAVGLAVRSRNTRLLVVTPRRLMIAADPKHGGQTESYAFDAVAFARVAPPTGLLPSERLEVGLNDGRTVEFGWFAPDRGARAIAHAVQARRPAGASPAPAKPKVARALLGAAGRTALAPRGRRIGTALQQLSGLAQEQADARGADRPQSARDDSSGRQTIEALMPRLRRLVDEAPPPHISNLYAAFVDQRGWPGLGRNSAAPRSPAAAGLAACHAGYVSRRAEEEATGADGAGSRLLRDYLAELWDGRTESAFLLILTAATAFADKTASVRGQPLELTTLPGFDPQTRSFLTGTALSGVQSSPDVSRDADPFALMQGWESGFVMRYAECSLPVLPDRDYHRFTPAKKLA